MKILIYNHGGSKNHGCEALVRTVIRQFPVDAEVTLLSDAVEEDRYYGIDNLTDQLVSSVGSFSKSSLSFVKAYADLKLKKDYISMDLLPYEAGIRKLDRDYDLAISIGGDVYCYENYPLYIRIHQLIRKKAKKTVLLGCSLENHLFEDSGFLKDIKSFDLITARESLTYDLLVSHGIQNVCLIPDTAFTLPKEECDIPALVTASIGINVSPLISRKNDKVYENYRYLIQKILETTSYPVTLIPHVVWENNDDRAVLKKLHDEFSDTGRVILIEDHNCMQLKYIISKCRFFIGARTHATIAAYSSCVPTLVMGYSIKSRGIARDLFGTSENYVLPVEQLKEKEDLWQAFRYILENETDIRKTLEEQMEGYIKRVNGIRSLIHG